LAFASGPPVGPRDAGGRRLIEGSVKTQARQHADARQCLDLVKQCEHRTMAVGHLDERSVGQPAPDESDHLPGTGRPGLMVKESMAILAGKEHLQLHCRSIVT
jgi:hypothetical protein